MRRPGGLGAGTLALALSIAIVGCVENVDEHPSHPIGTEAESRSEQPAERAPYEAEFTIDDAVRTLERDPTLFTQGLEFAEDGSLFHSGGRYGESRVVKTDPDGTVLAEFELPRSHFAEGLTVVGDELYVLTWRENIVHVLSADDLSEQDTFELATEGWGTCHSDAGMLWVSDGTDIVRGYDPADMSEQASITVTDPDGETVSAINELECIGDEIWANVWQDEVVLIFDTESGTIERMLDFSDLTPEDAGRDAVLNGIAFDSETGEVWITGKLWEAFYVFDYATLRGSV